MRKKKSIIGISVVAAFFMALAGCGKVDNGAVQEPIDSFDTDQIVQPVEEQAKEPIIKSGYTGELTGRMPRLAETKITLSSQVTTAAYMQDGVDQAEDVGLGTMFSVYGVRGLATYRPRLTTSGYITFYSKAGDTTGNGSYIDVTILDNRSISRIVINFRENESDARVTVPGEPERQVAVKEGDSYIIDSSSFRIQNGHVSVNNSNDQVLINSVDIYYEGSPEDTIDTLSTISSLSYNYTKTGNGGVDKLKNAVIGISDSTYDNWSVSDFASGASYSGNSGGDNGCVQLKSSNPAGIVTTANPNENIASKVVVKWATNAGATTRTVAVYGKNVEYESPADLYVSGTRGTKIDSKTYAERDGNDESVFIISGSYKFIGIRSSDNALNIESITIQWGEIPSYTYSDSAIRFSGFIKIPLWKRLNNIQGYGVMLSTKTYLGANTIESKYDSALAEAGAIDSAVTAMCAGNNVKSFNSSITSEKLHPAEATEEQKGQTSRDFYIWNLYKGVSAENLKTSYVAVAYIRTNSEIVFFDEIEASVKSLAFDLIDEGVENENSFDGSLNNLANLE